LRGKQENSSARGKSREYPARLTALSEEKREKESMCLGKRLTTAEPNVNWLVWICYQMVADPKRDRESARTIARFSLKRRKKAPRQANLEAGI